MAGSSPGRVKGLGAFAPGSVRRRFLLLTLAVTVPAMVGAGYLIRDAYHFTRQQTERQLLETARALSLVVDRQLGQSEALLHGLATSPDLQRGNLEAFDAQARLALPPGRAWIVLYDLTGRQLVNTHLPPGAQLPARQPGTLRAAAADILAGRRHICNLLDGPASGRRVLCVAVPVRRDGVLTHALAVVFEPRLLDDILVEQDLPREWYGVIADRSDHVLARSAETDKYRGVHMTPDVRAHLARAREGVKESVSLNGVETLAAYSRSPVTGWSFLVAMPRSELASALRRSLTLGTLGLGSLTALGLFLALLAARGLTRPIERLARDAARLAAGEAVTPQPTGITEIDEVGRTLSLAAANLAAVEIRLALAQRAGGIGLWEMDRASGYVWWSDTLRDLLGIDPAEPASAERFLSLILPEDRAGLDAVLANLETGAPYVTEFRIRRTTGELRWLASRGQCLRAEPLHLIGINFDITETKRLAESLAEANGRLERRVAARTAERDRMWRLSRDLFLVMHNDTGVVAANPAAVELLGWSEAELADMVMLDLVHPEDAAAAADVVETLKRGEVVERYECRLRCRDGSHHWLSWTAVPDEAGLIHAVGRDISVEKAAGDELAKVQAALHEVQKLETLGQLTGGVAHDFNNLLTPIIGSLDLLKRRHDGDERALRLIDGAMSSAERARTLVDRLLTFARRQTLESRPTDVAQLVRGMIELIERSLGPRISLAVDLPANLPPVSADPNQLELALLNLAVNARDAMPEGGRLAISANEDQRRPAQLAPGRYVALTVADSGSGMDAETLRRAVEPFYSTKGIGKGTGLGLSMVHGLAAQLGGALTLSSSPGAGTTATIWLPVSPEDARSDGIDEEPNEESRPAATVLLVDDEPLVRATAAQMLEDLGCTVVEASSGAQALRLLEDGLAVDALVSDQLMPGMTGVSLVTAARRLRPGLPAMIVSGYANETAIPADLPRLAKPFRSSELAARLGEIMKATEEI